MVALPMPEPAGYTYLVGENTSNIFYASLTAWSNAGETNMAMIFSFGLLPLLLMMMVYMRTEDTGNTLLTGTVASIFFWFLSVKLGLPFISNAISGIMSIILLLGWVYTLVAAHHKEN